MSVQAVYPARVQATLDPALSRWMWLVKWFLAIPHYFVLTVLYVAFALTSVVALFAILFTGRYPRGIFEFNAGVLRWSWRVSYYAFGAMGTDKYPPFTLRDVPDYPAHFDVVYPERLSRGLALVKWWLLAIPHYLVVGILVGGTWFAWSSEDWRGSSMGLIGILALIAVIVLAVRGTYPQTLFDLILGLNRWVLRVTAYAGLMTDEYPPFRLDMGGDEPGAAITVPGPDAAPAAESARSGWTGGRVTSLILGILFSFLGVAIAGAGGVGLWADQTQRDGAGFVVIDTERLATSTHALVAEDISIELDGPRAAFPDSILGDGRIRVTSADSSQSVFVGIAEAADVRRYLDGAGYASVGDFDDVSVAQRGGAPATLPGDESFWVRSSEGTGTQTLTWTIDDGDWTIIAMNSDGSAGVDLETEAGLEAPALTALSVVLLAIGGVILALAVLAIVIATVRASRRA